MAVATYKDLCIDAVDVQSMAAFWAAALGLVADPCSPADRTVHLAGATPEHGTWINRVPEARTVKQRVHLDLHGDSVGEFEHLGASRLSRVGEFAWTVLSDPEGGELCVFARSDPPAPRLADVPVAWDDPYRLYEVCVDSAGPSASARWWGEVLGAPAHDSARGFAWIADVPRAPFGSIAFLSVPEAKTVKNRIHWDVRVDGPDGIERLRERGASVLRRPGDEIGWSVMADPEGNEFCVFADDE